MPRVRPDAIFEPIVRDALRWSSIVRRLVDRLEQSDVTVYVLMRTGAPPTFNGHLTFLSSTPRQRYLVIELPPNRNRFEQIGMLGHELQHAVEIADAPAVVNVATLIAYYERIGIRTTSIGGHTTNYETEAAAASGRETWREAMETARHGADAY
jgi:hypothetical protein